MQVDDDERLFFLKDVTDTHKLILQRRRMGRRVVAPVAAMLGRMVGSSPRTISASDVNMDDLDWPEGIAPIWPQAPNPLQHKPLKPLQHIPAHNPVQPNPVEKDATVDPDDEAEFVAWSNRPVPATVTSPPADTPDPDEADFAATCWRPVAHPPPRD
eukprot:CAMPEP_0175983090 /NCGR_PEP_ID=MMETSP0108-20121206/48262_1 /TAXON_ID=195067 ORGANISM="Goniomonas pacifica, Strain CCMP1869" /NCGR_SAMPLE_ID=MMETSP0108 /ASSEMBLY_ACC=CAM_ASM_000204 /LENGTH=156 /DNA_ID=CAMNT_0017313821 /DNA_START=50 /DNA_END=521 /DNA_ORIENTATION=+